jgi:hypothetical protein
VQHIFVPQPQSLTVFCGLGLERLGGMTVATYLATRVATLKDSDQTLCEHASFWQWNDCLNWIQWAGGEPIPSVSRHWVSVYNRKAGLICYGSGNIKGSDISFSGEAVAGLDPPDWSKPRKSS